MNIYALLSWYDEDPAHLTRCIQSLNGFADHVIAVEGPYATFPAATADRVAEGAAAIDTAATMPVHHHTHHGDTEVGKRARMFQAAREHGATDADWLLIIDADTSIATHNDARRLLADTSLDVADVSMSNLHGERQDAPVTMRCLYRAIPGLTVQRTHWLYITPGPPRRYLWHTPDGNISSEPALNLTANVTLHHHIDRHPERKARAARYYVERDQARIEHAGDWL